MKAQNFERAEVLEFERAIVQSLRRSQLPCREKRLKTPRLGSDDRRYAHEHGEIGPTVEKGSEATIFLRLPATLKKHVDRAAARAELSTNAWAMKCLERCLTQEAKA